MRKLFVVLLVSGWLAVVGHAQQPNLDPKTNADKPAPVVAYDQVFPGVIPAHFAVAVESTRRAAYRSDDIVPEGVSASSKGDPFEQKFTVSETTRARIFQLTKQANYFRGNFNYTKGRIANTGAKTLSYSDGPEDWFGKPTNGVRYETTYNYSENTAIQELTTIFQNISNTLELGRRLNHFRRFDRLGLDAELKRAEEMAESGQLLELQAILPALQQVVDDSRVLHIARESAQHLIGLAQASAGSTR
jgi:hypothetical protein